jgi:LEA14-like dessication related protein
MSGGFGLAALAFAASLFVMAAAPDVAAQGRVPVERLGGRLVKMKVGEITLESIDFRNQTAQLNLGLDVSNGLLPVSLKDFDYALRLNGQDTIEGTHNGTLKVGGRNSSRVNLPVTVHLRSIPGTIWSAFRNRGRVQYELDAGFTLPLFITEQRFDQSFAGEVPLRTLVDAASILRASNMGGGNGSGGADNRRGGILGWPF